MELYKRAQWLAVVRDNSWLVAKVNRRKKIIQIEHLAEYGRIESIVHESQTEDILRVGENEQNLQRWLKEQKIPLQKLKIAFSCRGLITRVIVLPEISGKDLERLLTEQVEQYFTLNIDDYVVDYRVLEHFLEDEQPRQRILIAAVPKPVWEPFWETCQKVGWQPRTVDLVVDSLVRIYAWTSALPFGGQRFQKESWKRQHSTFRMAQQFVHKLHLKLPVSVQKSLSSRQSSLLKSSEGRSELFKKFLPKLKPSFIKDKPEQKKRKFKLNFKRKKKTESDTESNLGLDPASKGPNPVLPDITIVALNKSRAEIVILERGIFFLYSDLELDWQRTERANVMLPKLEETLFPVFRVLAEFINFFAARHFGKAIDEIFLTGELADVPHLIELFEENFGIPTSVGFPSDWQPLFTKKAVAHEQHWMKYADLYGMALRED